jgi:hypothetical protein
MILLIKIEINQSLGTIHALKHLTLDRIELKGLASFGIMAPVKEKSCPRGPDFQYKNIFF